MEQKPFVFTLALSVASGLLSVLVFPKFSSYYLSGVALAPLFVAGAGERRGARRFLAGWLSGAIFFAGACYWIYGVMRQYGGLGVAASSLVFVLFFIAFACYFGLFSFLAGKLWGFPWGPLAVPLLWVAIEYARSYLITGFPWLLLGYALTDFPSIAWIARWTGVYGLSFLIVSANVAVALLALGRIRYAAVVAGSIAAMLAGLWAAAPAEIYRESETAYLVQSNIPEEVAFQSWDEATQSALLQRLRSLTKDGMSGGATNAPPLVVWAEMPAPFYFEEGSFARDYATKLAREANSYFTLGIVAYVPGSQRSKPMNSAVLIEPSGSVASQYDKIHLVPFGEYVPWKELLRFADKLTAEVSDFVPGNQYVVNRLPGGTFSGFICYEAIFPDLVRRFAKEGAEVLVNTSNDGWFGTSAARYQHLLMARMRAIENRRYLLRATNTGITTVVRPDGRIAKEIPPDEPGVLEARYSFLKERTFYTMHGDVFAIASCALAGLAIAAGARKAKNKMRPRHN